MEYSLNLTFDLSVVRSKRAFLRWKVSQYYSFNKCHIPVTLCYTNVISVYCFCLFQSLGLAHFVWITPLQCILYVGLIWELIEVNGFCALAALTLLGIIQAWLSQKMGPHR